MSEPATVEGLATAVGEVVDHHLVTLPGLVWMSWLDGFGIPAMRRHLAGRFTDLSTSAGHLEIYTGDDGLPVYLNRQLRPATAALALLRYRAASTRDLLITYRWPAGGLVAESATEELAVGRILDLLPSYPGGDIIMLNRLRDIVAALGGPAAVMNRAAHYLS